jgi:hypothetical protein
LAFPEEGRYLGQTTDDVQHEKLGAYQIPLTLYVKGRRPLVRSVLAVRFQWFFPDRPLKYPNPTSTDS